MSEGQIATATSTGTPTNSQEGPRETGKISDRVTAGHPKIKRALGANASGVPSAAETGKSSSQETINGSGERTEQAAPAPEAFNNKLKLKVQGKEIELDLNDPNDRREAQRRLQMDVAAEVRMQQAAQREQKIAQLLEMAEKDPWGAAQHLAKLKNPQANLDKVEFAKNIIAEQIKQEMMDPNQRALMEERSQREQIQKQLEERNQKDQNQYQEALKAQKAQKWEGEIIQALEGADLPKDPVAVRLMAQNLLDAKTNGYDLSPQEAAHYTKKQMVSVASDLLNAMTPAQIEKHFGKAVIDKIISYQVEKVRAPLNQPFANKPSLKPDVSPERKERKWRDWTEVREVWDRRAKT